MINEKFLNELSRLKGLFYVVTVKSILNNTEL